MKHFIYKKTLVLAASFVVFISCTKEDDYEIPAQGTEIYKEDFNTAVNNTNFDFENWTNYAEEGTSLWREKTFTSNGVTNGYAEFSAFGSGSTLNIVWLVSPELDLDLYSIDGVSFKIAQHHLDKDSPLNSLEVFISSDYNGSNVKNATWKKLNANVPNKSTSWYEFIQSKVRLDNYSGKVHVAFKFIGSGTNQDYDGAFQVDDFIFYKHNK